VSSIRKEKWRSKKILTPWQGSRHSIAVIRDLFWKPFDSRFGALLDRLQDHQELFDIELRLEDQGALDRFIRTVEEDIAKKERIRQDKYDRIADQQREILSK
jgi:hypothetical protein